jgi:hypothetical protein
VVDITTDSNHTIAFIGDSADKVTLDSTLSKTGTSTEVINGTEYTFDVYSAGTIDPTVIVKVKQDISS